MSGFNPSDERWRTITNPLHARLTSDGTGAGTPVAGMAQGQVYAMPALNRLLSTMAVAIDLPHVWRLQNALHGTVIQGGSGAANANTLIWVGDTARMNANTDATTGTYDPFGASPFEDASTALATAVGSWGRVRIAECMALITDPTGSAGIALNASADTKAGIAFGCPNTAAVIGSGGTAYPLVALYCDFSTATWKIIASRSPLPAGQVVATLIGVDQPVTGKTFHLRLIHDPIKGKVSGWVNGIEGASINDASKMPLANVVTNGRAELNCFAQSGSTAGASIDMSFAYPTEHVIMPWR